jgi:hypothetical protein
MIFDLVEDDTRALAVHLRHAPVADPYPFASRLRPLKAIYLAKLDPPKPQP